MDGLHNHQNTSSNMAEIKNNWQEIVEGLPSMKSESFDLSRTYYRYMSEEAFDYIMKGCFKFNNPANWWDPFESLMVNGDYSDLGYNKPATYVACFSRLASSEAHWKMYKRNLNETCVRVEFDMTNFIGTFNLGEVFDTQSHIYIGDVSYDLAEKSILSLGKTSKYHKQAVPSPFTEKDYVDLLLLKRKPYKWEEEARMVVLRNEPQQNELFLCFDPSIAKTFIKSIKIEPNKKDDRYKELYKKYKEWWDSLDNPLYSNTFNCTKSKLYDEREPLVFKK